MQHSWLDRTGILKWLAILSVGTAIWLIPAPAGVSDSAWHLFAVFIATIVGIIAQPLPMGAMAMLGIIATVLTGTLSITQALSGFSNRVIWLIVTAFFISRGFAKTGLGTRIAYLFIALLGRRTLGLAYGFLATDLVLAPAIPSNTARGAGLIFPILRSTAQTYQSDPDDGTQRRIGAFLMLTSFQGINVTSAMFLTAMAANPLAVELANSIGVNISWGMWAAAAAVPGLLSLLIIPYVIYRLYPPEVTETPGAARLAKDKLAEMGSMSTKEWILLGVFFLLIVLWIFGENLQLHSTSAALVGLGLLLLTRVLSWEDILSERGAWDTLVWFSALVMMASFLNELGLVPWFGESVQQLVSGQNWVTAFLILCLVYFYSHYFFASNTAHVSSMYLPFLAVALALGTPGMLAALVLAFFSNLFSGITHYGNGLAPVFFGSGYVSLGAWWRLGFVVSVVNVIIWLGIGGMWWKLLGLW